MLVLTRKVNEAIVIEGDVIVKVVELSQGRVKLGIEAPLSKNVHRQEVWLELQEEKASR